MALLTKYVQFSLRLRHIKVQNKNGIMFQIYLTKRKYAKNTLPGLLATSSSRCSALMVARRSCSREEGRFRGCDCQRRGKFCISATTKSISINYA